MHLIPLSLPCTGVRLSLVPFQYSPSQVRTFQTISYSPHSGAPETYTLALGFVHPSTSIGARELAPLTSLHTHRVRSSVSGLLLATGHSPVDVGRTPPLSSASPASRPFSFRVSIREDFVGAVHRLHRASVRLSSRHQQAMVRFTPVRPSFSWESRSGRHQTKRQRRFPCLGKCYPQRAPCSPPSVTYGPSP